MDATPPYTAPGLRLLVLCQAELRPFSWTYLDRYQVCPDMASRRALPEARSNYVPQSHRPGAKLPQADMVAGFRA
jgi:hypothetical protein